MARDCWESLKGTALWEASIRLPSEHREIDTVLTNAKQQEYTQNELAVTNMR